MIAALLLSCVPDLVNYTPTPVISWDRVSYCSRSVGDPKYAVDCDVGAYRVFRRPLGSTVWTPVHDVPCWWYVSDELDGPLHDCVTYVATQRYVSEELEMSSYCVKAVSAIGVESDLCSGPVQICAPTKWDVGEEPYP